jgi:hypothetical protein
VSAQRVACHENGLDDCRVLVVLGRPRFWREVLKVVGNQKAECHQEESGEKRLERTHLMLIDERRQKEGSDHISVCGFSFVSQWTRTCGTTRPRRGAVGDAPRVFGGDLGLGFFKNGPHGNNSL